MTKLHVLETSQWKQQQALRKAWCREQEKEPEQLRDLSLDCKATCRVAAAYTKAVQRKSIANETPGRGDKPLAITPHHFESQHGTDEGVLDRSESPPPRSTNTASCFSLPCLAAGSTRLILCSRQMLQFQTNKALSWLLSVTKISQMLSLLQLNPPRQESIKNFCTSDPLRYE